MRVYIPKKPGSSDLRAIDMPTVLDQAVLYLLHDWSHATHVLTRIAVGFRRGVQMHHTVLNAYAAMRKRPFVAVIDIAGFFDSIDWHLVDRIIRRLPADQDVQDLLGRLVRVEVVERLSGARMERRQGIPQGLSVSPVLANLVLDEFDRGAGHALSRLGVGLRRYCDDIIVISPSMAAGAKAVVIVRDRLERLGLTVKQGTGNLVDTREQAAVWLGVSFGPDGLAVPEAAIEAKAARLQAKLDQGVLDAKGVEDSLMSLDQHYRRIIGPERSQAVVLSIKGDLALPVVPHVRKEGAERLRQLAGERHHRGHMYPRALPYGKPDDVDANSAQGPQEDLGIERSEQCQHA
jgi:hypothetical protein